jgi:hypothetical protein
MDCNEESEYTACTSKCGTLHPLRQMDYTLLGQCGSGIGGCPANSEGPGNRAEVICGMLVFPMFQLDDC